MKKEVNMIPQIKKILYATDLSKNSHYAFFYAVDMAKRHNARIVLLHSIEPVHYGLVDEDRFQRVAKRLQEEKKREGEKDLREMKDGLQEFCKRTEAQIGPPCVELVSKILVPTGHPVDEILKAADDEGCDAIVLGSHGKGFLKHTFLGSVSSGVLHRTRKPVFIVPLPSEKTNIDWDKI
jgi:nucleotide-binding universal stress UspA family protein